MAVRTLLVDDSAFTREIVKQQLRAAGAEVIGTAKDGREAVEQYEKLKPRLVMMVLYLPVMNGIEALKEIIKLDRDAQVVIYTSAGQELLKKMALDAGATAYMDKPLDQAALAALVRRLS